ncbi:MAG TPA: FAD-dependent oxidoreductase [Opitutaceae bacterium]|nr:FAD-dependent oxidoreductase [Opitutaceae bacterium]
MSQHYDFLVIGGGSAGFNAARVAREHAERVAIVDGAEKLGGLCILRGCMPSKTLIYSAEVLHLARHGKLFGLQIDGARADMKAVHERKLRIIGEFADYREKALNSGRFAIHRAMARFRDAHTVELSNGETLTADRILIGTGSRVAWPDIPGLAESGAWTSDDVLELDFLPESVIVLGGGIVACELAQFLARMGSRVIQIQRSARILRDFSPGASSVIEKVFREEGIELFTGTHLKAVRKVADVFEVDFKHEGKTVTRKAAHLLNALGRVPDTGSLNLAAAGVELHADGRIAINEWQQTSQTHIYGGGDCTGPHEIVHVAVAQGELAARHSFGVKGIRPINYNTMVHVVFTDPQVAVAGIGPLTLSAQGVPHIDASYPFDDHGKSILMEAKHGFVRVVATPGDGRIISAEIVGKDGGELIHAFSVGITMRATVHDMLRAQWYHPTLSEIITYPLEEIAEKIPPKIPPTAES